MKCRDNREPLGATTFGAVMKRAMCFAAAGALWRVNPGCLMQVDSALRRSGSTMALAHTIEVLDASLRGADIASIGVTSSR